MSGFLQTLRERVVIFDGAMGTQLHAAGLSLDDYQGQEGNSEVLNFSRPDVVAAIHAAYFDAGADVVETNTFGGNAVVQGEYDAADRVYDLNLAAARIARDVASSFTDRPRWVAGSMGPGTKLPSLGHATFAELAASYETQARGLVDGGADLLIVETCQDMLQLKSALGGVLDAFAATGKRLPLIVQVTIETTGTMLLGTEIAAALAALEPYSIIDVIGLNCATGPLEMTEHVRYLCQSSVRPVSVQPNAGLPELKEGKPWYPLTPEQMVAHQRVFVEEFGTSIAGGCCGTTPEFIRDLANAFAGREPKRREPAFDPACASLYVAQPFRQDTSFFVIGERANAQGSRRFKELVAAEDWDTTIQVAREQVREGAHALDVCVDYTGRDGVADMISVIERYRTQVTLPLFIDSTEPPVIEAALAMIGGRAVINSINLEEGDGEGSRIARNLALAQRFGAACVALAIDEQGQATTAEWKLQVCKRLRDTAAPYGVREQDLIFDALTFPITTGMEEQRRAGIETLDAIEAIKREIPGCFTSLGVSNVSFGLTPAARQVLNSVFLHECVARGLDAAIVSPRQILPVAKIPAEQRQVALDLIYDRRRDGYDPLAAYLALFEGVSSAATHASAETLAGLPLDERLKRRIIDGERDGLTADLDESMSAGRSALEIINETLLDGMRVVGELFGAGEMQLPFVLQSAETMKAAVAHLEPHMEKSGDGGKGRIVLATVRGDVHDIGKNLVDIILTNNGYTVHNIGIKQPISNIIEAAERERVDAIGLSGLLVKSTVVMREDLEELNRRELHHYPVLLGGAALTRGYVEHDLRDIYRGTVFYGRDAFEGLHTMDAIMQAKRSGTTLEAPKPRRERPKRRAVATEDVPARSDVRIDVPVPVPPFTGHRLVKGIGVADVAKYLNKAALYKNQWNYKRKRSQTPEEYAEFLQEKVEPILRSLLDRSIADGLLAPAVVYGYFPAQSEGNDLIVYGDGGVERVRFTFPRQPRDRHLCLADFFRPVESGEMDVVAFHLVTMGRRVSEETKRLFDADRYTDYLYLHGLGVEMAEALAEVWHRRIREELGIAGDDGSNVEDLFDSKYRGARYSFGYPACPNLEDQAKVFELLEPERIGVSLSEEFQLDPEQSTSAIIVHHPEARYFSVGRAAITPDA